jgi:hypothetical protein
MDLRSSTITANRLLGRDGAGGIWVSGPMVLRNTILAGNFHDETNRRCTRPIASPATPHHPSPRGTAVGDAYHCRAWSMA